MYCVPLYMLLKCMFYTYYPWHGLEFYYEMAKYIKHTQNQALESIEQDIINILYIHTCAYAWLCVIVFVYIYKGTKGTSSVLNWFLLWCMVMLFSALGATITKTIFMNIYAMRISPCIVFRQDFTKIVFRLYRKLILNLLYKHPNFDFFIQLFKHILWWVTARVLVSI